jgi:retinol dehydrogenase 12
MLTLPPATRVNNAAIMEPPSGSLSAQNHELQLATNCLGPFLLTKLLLPLLQKTASTSPPGSVRVSWAGSIGVEVSSPHPGGIFFDAEGSVLTHDPQTKQTLSQIFIYGASKTGNLYVAHEFARRYASSGIISNSLNPGNLKTELQRNMVDFTRWVVQTLLCHPPVYGAYTE